TDKTLPYPKFAWYDDPNELRYNPLNDLALELSEGEWANYTVREVKEGLKVSFEGVGKCEAEIKCGDKTIGMLDFDKGNILQPMLSEAFSVGQRGERVTVKVIVRKGTLTLKKVKFAY
ncbi:MAG: hypothetical protein IIY45_11005, partial [Firmicutes bacterium]|nr:hypothetical protein [Bacillota bacterium]